MQKQNNKNGIIIFAAISLIILIVCLVAYIITGNQGIEQRFANAVGLPSPTDEGDNGIFGFTLEGNHLSYLIILGLILIGTAIIYIKYKV